MEPRTPDLWVRCPTDCATRPGSMERKKMGQIEGRISRRRLSHSSIIQYIIITCLPNMTTPACKISQKSLTKNFIIQSMERKKISQIQRRISMRRLVCNPTIQYIIINLHTKYDYSSLHTFTEIFDEKFHYSKYGKKIGQIQGRIREESWFAIPWYNTSLSNCISNMTTLACTLSQKSLTKNFIIQNMERKSDKYREE